MAKNEEKTLEQLTEELIQAQKAYDAKKEEIIKEEKERAERKQAELALEKDKRRKEIEEAEKHYHNLIKQYIEDYGKYEVSCSYEDDDDFLSFLFGSKPFKFFI